MHTPRKALSLLLTFAMVFTLLPAAAISAWAEDAVAQVGEATFSDLQDAVDAAQNGDTVKLLRDAVLNRDIDTNLIIQDKTITLDLNDHGVILKYNRSGYRVIRLNGTANLTLIDSSEEKSRHTRYIGLHTDGEGNPGRGWSDNIQDTRPDTGVEGTDYLEVTGGYITGGYASGNGGGGVLVTQNATFTMEGGTICGNTTGAKYADREVGGGVFSQGTFIMKGGTIRNNTSHSNGGGVFASGKFEMSGGTICGNSAAASGGGVYATGKFTMSGGTICGNSANAGFGGGVCVEASGTFAMSGGTIGGEGTAKNTALYGGGVFLLGGDANKMTGGSISGNVATANGGGIYAMGTFTMDGATAEISGNAASAADQYNGYGGGIYVSELAVSHFIMKNGTIKNNTASNNGGGVCVQANDKFDMSDGAISGNTAAVFGGGVFVQASGTFTMSGGTIGGTTDAAKNAALYGGGVFVQGLDETTLGTFTMTGGAISGNAAVTSNTNIGHGGGVYVIGEFEMNGANAVISGNAATGNGGGVGIHEFAFSKFSLKNGSVKGNSAATFGGGVNVYGSGVFAVSGGAVAQSNVIGGAKDESGLYTGGTVSNVYLSSGKRIGVTATLTDDAAIGVTLADNSGVFTDGLSGKGVAARFTSDNRSYGSRANDAGEAQLVSVCEVSVTGGTGGGGYVPGETVNVSAAAPAGERFTSWTASGITLSDEQAASESITFVMPGTAVTLTANFEDKPLESISLPATLSLKRGATQKLTPTFAPSDFKNTAVTWTSADTSIVTVDENGKLTAITAGGPVTITATSAADSTKTATCAVTVTRASSGSHDRDRDDSKTETKTETNVDGSKTETKTNADGSTTKTTTAKDGATTAVTTAKDGGTTTEAKAADGSTGTVKTDASGNTVSAEAKPSEKAVEAAQASGKPVTLAVEVKATNDSKSAAEVHVSAPVSVSAEHPMQVEIPVENLTAGTVAVLVKPDGTEEIVKTSTTGEGSVVLSVSGDVTLKIVDNTKTFDDVKGDEWCADNIAWASSHEIMNGVGDGKFDMDATTSRGMITQILMNLDGGTANAGDAAHFADVDADDWYAASVAWATETGIAQGEGEAFGANEAVTREQDIVMMYNYAKYKGCDVSASADLSKFADADSVSDYAKEAMAWAVAVGLINGSTDENGNVVLDAQGTATRGQIAAITQRFCEKVIK